MYTVKFSLIILTSSVCLTYASVELFYDLNKVPEMFVKYINDYDKRYKNVFDLLNDYKAFKDNVIEINRCKEESETCGQMYELNTFADFTRQEIKQLFPGFEYKDSDIYVSEERPILTLEQTMNYKEI